MLCLSVSIHDKDKVLDFGAGNLVQIFQKIAALAAIFAFQADTGLPVRYAGARNESAARMPSGLNRKSIAPSL